MSEFRLTVRERSSVKTPSVAAIPEEYPWVVHLRYHRRYWPNEIDYTLVYQSSFRNLAAWCYRNFGHCNYRTLEGAGKNQYFAVRTKQQAMLFKLTWG